MVTAPRPSTSTTDGIQSISSGLQGDPADRARSADLRRRFARHLRPPLDALSPPTITRKLFLQADGELEAAPSGHVSMLPVLRGVDCFAYQPSVRDLIGADARKAGAGSLTTGYEAMSGCCPTLFSE